MFIFEVAKFYLKSIKYSVNSIFSVVLCIRKIYVFHGVIPCQLIQNFWIMPWIFFFEIFTSGRYHRDKKSLKILASKCKHIRIYGKVANWCASLDILNITFSLITSVSINLRSWIFTGVCFLFQEIQKWYANCPETYWFWSIGKSYENSPFSIYL